MSKSKLLSEIRGRYSLNEALKITQQAEEAGIYEDNYITVIVSQKNTGNLYEYDYDFEVKK